MDYYYRTNEKRVSPCVAVYWFTSRSYGARDIAAFVINKVEHMPARLIPLDQGIVNVCCTRVRLCWWCAGINPGNGMILRPGVGVYGLGRVFMHRHTQRRQRVIAPWWWWWYRGKGAQGGWGGGQQKEEARAYVFNVGRPTTRVRCSTERILSLVSGIWIYLNFSRARSWRSFLGVGA